MFITKRVFDPDLEGEAVFIRGKVNPVCLVVKVYHDQLTMVGKDAKPFTISMDSIESGIYKIEILKREIDLPKNPDPLIRDKSKRKVLNRHPRTKQQIDDDNKLIEDILRESIEPMQLMYLLKEMRKRGSKHWNNGNSSSFVKHAIQCGYPVKKIKTGFYGYDWGNEDGKQAN